MKSFELLRAAATLILEGGWAAGVNGMIPIDAADNEGNPIPLYVTGSTETGRAAPNPAAVRFSAYGAIVTALHRGGGRLEDPAAMWALLAKRASEINKVAHGGDNFVHPLHQLNATKGMTAEKVLDFLGYCATEMESVSRTLDALKEPIEVRAIPRLTEPMTAVDVYRLGPKSIEARQAHLTPEQVRALPRLTEPAPFTLQTPMTNFNDRVALGPHPSQPPATLREVFDAVLDPNAKPLPPALTVEDVKDLHTTLAVPVPSPTPPMIEGLKAALGPPIPPYKPMLTPGRLREEHPPALYSGPELNMKGMPNPFGGDDEQH